MKKKKRGGFTPPEKVTIIREVVYVREESSRAQPISVGHMSWQCSKCGISCYYDGRCGDGPILMCQCNAAEDAWWAMSDRR